MGNSGWHIKVSSPPIVICPRVSDISLSSSVSTQFGLFLHLGLELLQAILQMFDIFRLFQVLWVTALSSSTECTLLMRVSVIRLWVNLRWISTASSIFFGPCISQHLSNCGVTKRFNEVDLAKPIQSFGLALCTILLMSPASMSRDSVFPCCLLLRLAVKTSIWVGEKALFRVNTTLMHVFRDQVGLFQCFTLHVHIKHLNFISSLHLLTPTTVWNLLQ